MSAEAGCILSLALSLYPDLPLMRWIHGSHCIASCFCIASRRKEKEAGCVDGVKTGILVAVSCCSGGRWHAGLVSVIRLPKVQVSKGDMKVLLKEFKISNVVDLVKEFWLYYCLPFWTCSKYSSSMTTQREKRRVYSFPVPSTPVSV